MEVTSQGYVPAALSLGEVFGILFMEKATCKPQNLSGVVSNDKITRGLLTGLASS
jgi:hypothetical protein